MKATHKTTEGKTNRQLANMALKAMSSLQGYSNGSISNPSELASHVMPDKRTLIQTIYEDGYVMYNDGIHIVEVDDNALYVDLTGYGMRECQITKMEIDTDFEYHDEKILNKPEIKYQSKRTNTMETTIKSVSKAIKELVMLGEKNLVPFGNSIGIIDQDWINLDVMFKKILQEDEKNRNEAKKILSEPLNTKSEEIAQEKKIKELDKKFNAFIDGCAKELLQLCENEEKQIPIAVYNLKNVINSHLLSENGKFDKILKHIGDIKDESFVNKLVINKNIHASSIIYNELSEHVFTGIKTRTEAEHSLNNALNGYAYDIINTCKIKDISLYLRQTDFPASINADRKTYRIGGHDVVVSWNKNKVMINDTASKEAIADKALQRLKYLGKTDYSVQDNYGLASRKFKTQKDAFNAFAELSGSLQVMEYNRHKINGSSFSTNGHYEESLKWSADIRFTGNEVVDFASLSDADRNEIADILFEGDQHGTLSSIGVEWDANFDIEVIDKPGDYRYFELIPLNAVEEIAESIRNGNLSGEVEVSVIQLGPFFEEEIALDNLVDNRQEVASVVLDYLNYEQASVGDVIDVLGLTGKDDKVYDNVQEIMDRHGVEFSPIEKMIELGFQERDDMRWIIAEECSKELLEYKQSVEQKHQQSLVNLLDRLADDEMIDVSPDYLENLYRYHLTGKWHTDFTDGDDDKIMLRYMTENPELFEKCFPEVKAESVRQEHVKRDEVIIGDNKLDASQLLELLQKRKLTIEGITINGRKCTAVLKMDENNKIEKQFHPLKRNQHLGATATKPTTTKAPMTKRKGVGMS